MNTEDRLRDAFAALESVEPAPDLLHRINQTVSIDRSRRRRRTVWLLASASVATGFVVLFVTMTQGGFKMPWWTLELIATLLLIAIGLMIGPLIRRYGKAYAADIFRANPRTGKSFLVLTDFAYYLIVVGYILMTATFAPRSDWAEFTGTTFEYVAGAAQLQWEAARTGGLLLLLGVLHGINLVVLPVIGRLFTKNLRLDRDLLDDR